LQSGNLEMPAGPTLSIVSTGIPGLDELLRGGSSAYVPTDPAKDKQLMAAFDLLRHE